MPHDDTESDFGATRHDSTGVSDGKSGSGRLNLVQFCYENFKDID